MALMAMGENGHIPGNDYAQDVYAETVQNGINNLVSVGVSQPILDQNGQVTDTNGNTRGIYVGDGVVYDHCLAALAIIGSFPNKAAAQAAAIPFAAIGVVPTKFPKVTSYYDFAVDMLDTLFWSQSDTDPKGWHYNMTAADSGGVDGSTHQWPNIVFLAAKDRWGFSAPGWVITNSINAYIALQDHTGDATSNNGYGGCGYGSYSSWRNNGKAGGMLAAYTLGGKLVGVDIDATIGYDFIGRTWIAPPSDGTGVDINSGWPGNWYYMYGIKKGLQLQKVATIQVRYDDTNSGPRDWNQDLSAWLLGDSALLDAPVVNNPNNVKIAFDLRSKPEVAERRASMFGQFPDGHWEGHAWPSDNRYPTIQTAGAILTLSKSITVAVPVAVAAPVPDQSARKPAAFHLDGSASYHLDPNSSIVEWLWKLDAGATPDWSHPDANGQKVTVNPGWKSASTHTATLRVKDNQTPPQFSTATVNIVVSLNDVPPVAVPIPASRVPQIYTGRVGEIITLDGSDSYDPDGDPIISYAWDLNGDGIYGDAADQALDTSGFKAKGATAKVKFTAAHNGQIGLQVGSQPPGGVPPVYSANKAAIDIYAALSDLYVQSLSVANLQPGRSADIHAIVKNDVASVGNFTGVLVRIYDGDPFGAGVQIGGNYSVNLPIGATARLDATVPLKAGQQSVHVKVDANNVIPEWDEKNNVASVSVIILSNQPPVARAKNVTVIAGPNCSGNASIDNGSYDPDAGDGIVFRQLPAGPYPIGTTTVTLVVTDNHGASSQATANVTVLDKSPPTLTVPANIVVNTDPGQSTAVVTYKVSAQDHCSTATVSTDIPSGTAFPVGSSTVTATARDASGNAASATFTVTVKDAEKPVVAAHGDLTVEATSAAGAVVNYGVGQATDNVGVTSLTYSKANGTTFPIGITTVTITAKDAAGNVGTGTFTVKVSVTTGVIVLHPTEYESLYVGGNAHLDVGSNASIFVNSSDQQEAFEVSGQGSVTARGILVVGNSEVHAEASAIPAPLNGQARMPDPLASLVAPSTAGLNVYRKKDIKKTSILQPGIYADELKVSGKATITLAPGVYILMKGLEVSGDAIINGTGVMLYNQAGQVKVSGKSKLNLTAPSSGTHAGVTLFQARDNRRDVIFDGHSQATIGGAFYLPAAELELEKDSDLQFSSSSPKQCR